MVTKLTLTMDKGVIEKAKRYAKEKDRSLSNLIEHLLKPLLEKNDDPDFEDGLAPNVKAMLGSFETPKGFDYEKELETIRDDKFKSYQREHSS